MNCPPFVQAYIVAGVRRRKWRRLCVLRTGDEHHIIIRRARHVRCRRRNGDDDTDEVSILWRRSAGVPMRAVRGDTDGGPMAAWRRGR